jgi:hypothetical protein
MIISSVNLSNINELKAPLRPESIKVWDHVTTLWKDSWKSNTELPADVGLRINTSA